MFGGQETSGDFSPERAGEVVLGQDSTSYRSGCQGGAGGFAQLFRSRNSGYGQVMVKLADGLYHQRRGADLLAGQLDADGWVDAGQGRRWR